MNTKRTSFTIFTILVALAMSGCTGQPVTTTAQGADVEIGMSYIVQAESAKAAERAVRESGGLVTHTLPIIRAVRAKLTSQQRQAIHGHHTPDQRRALYRLTEPQQHTEKDQVAVVD